MGPIGRKSFLSQGLSLASDKLPLQAWHDTDVQIWKVAKDGGLDLHLGDILGARKKLP